MTTDNEFLNDLLYFSNVVCNIPLETTKIENILYLDSDDFLQMEYTESQSFIFQNSLINAPEKQINLILNNLTKAIKTNCNNEIELNNISTPHDFGYSVRENQNEKSISKRFKDYTIRPNDKELFKQIWLKGFVLELEKIDFEIRALLNLSPPPAESKTDKLKAKLVKYGFFELPKVKQLSEPNKQNLVELLSTNQMPYGIAMFDYLGFCEHLDIENVRKYKANIILSRLYNENAKDGTSAKHLRSSLIKPTPRYKAGEYKETVKTDYLKLK